MKYEKITKYGIGPADQLCLYFVKKRHSFFGNFRISEKAIWGIQNTGISVHTLSQGEPETHPNSRNICGFYRKTGPRPYQTHKSNCIVKGSIDQHRSKNSTGGVFIKTRPWRKKREELKYPVLMTGFVSKNSHRFTVSLSLIQNLIITRIRLSHLKKI